MKKNLLLATLFSASIFFIDASFADTQLKTVIINSTFYRMTISSPWQPINGTSCTYISINNPIQPGFPLMALNADGNCGDGQTQVGFKAAYDVYDKNGNYLTNCTFQITGYPDGRNGFNSWTNVHSNTYCTGGANVSVYSAQNESVINFNVNSPI